MNIVTLPLDKIDDTDRLRPVDPAWVQVIAESIGEQGQMTPIEVAEAGPDGRHRLISGAHRVAAMRSRLCDSIEAVVFAGSEMERQVREIDENLCRADLNDLDRAIFLGRRKELYEMLHPHTIRGKSKRKQDVAQSATILRFTLDAARLMKRSERIIQKLIFRYEHLSPAVRERLRGTWVAKVGTELDALARLRPDEQMQAVDMLLREHDAQPDVKSAKIAIRGIVAKSVSGPEEEFAKLVALWSKTGREARAQFKAFLSKKGAA